MKRIYLDYNATTPLRPEAQEAMIAAFDLGNPSAVHAEGRKAKGALERARNVIADKIDAPENGLIFTGGGTEAITMAIWGMALREVDKANNEPIKRIFLTAIEHSAVQETAEFVATKLKLEVEIIPVGADGHYDTDWFNARMADYDAARDGAFLCMVMLANNETGVIQNIEKIRTQIFMNGGFLFIDAAQAVGKIPVSFNNLQADLMSIAAHKFGGPKGVGALATKPGLPLAPLLNGGGQELRRRAGTENMIGIMGMAAAIDAVKFDEWTAVQDMRDEMEAALCDLGVTIWGEGHARLPNTSYFTAHNGDKGFTSETQLMHMDLGGISVSSGSACSSGKVNASKVLTAMGVPAEIASCALRVTLGWDTTQSDIDKFLDIWKKGYAHAMEK